MATFDLVFEGGGAKGSVFVGALEVLQAAGHTPRRLIGTSAGAITATLLAAGYTPAEMLAAVNERLPNGKPRFSVFMDQPAPGDFTDAEKQNSDTMQLLNALHLPGLPPIHKLDEILLRALLALPPYCQLFSLVESGGLFTGVRFRQWLEEKLLVKGVNANTTLKAFFDLKGVDLSVVASDTTDVEMLVLNHRTAPDCPLAWAVRMSMGIPFVWREVVWRQEWGLYRGRDKTGNTIVDGGVLSNFPIRLIDLEPEDDVEIAALMGATRASDAGNLGLLIDEKLAVAGAADTRKTPDLIGRLRTVQRVARLIDTMRCAQDNDEIRAHEAEICRLPAKGYGTTEFDMPQTRLDLLVEAGRSAMRQHLAGRSFGATAS